MEPNEPFDGWVRIGRLIFVFAFVSAASFWVARRSVQQHILPLKRRLEALLKELDG